MFHVGHYWGGILDMVTLVKTHTHTYTNVLKSTKNIILQSQNSENPEICQTMLKLYAKIIY